MESFTSGKVSDLARRRYLHGRNLLPKDIERMFSKQGNQWIMYAWESQIDRARILRGTVEDTRLRLKADTARGFIFK